MSEPTRRTDEQLNARLCELFSMLATSQREALKQIVTLTAPHLNGILNKRMSNTSEAEHLLRQLYKDVWTVRKHPALQRDPLNLLRAYAHHCTVELGYGVAPNAERFFKKTQSDAKQITLSYSDTERNKLKNLYLSQSVGRTSR